MRRPGELNADGRFEAFFREHHERVRHYAARRVSPNLVDDVAAQTFIVAWRKFAQVSEPSLAWLLRIASYELRNVARLERSRTRPGPAGEIAVSGAEPPDVDQLHEALALLSERDREILRLVHWDDLSRTEIAQVLDLSVGAVNVRYHRAKARLETLLPHPEGAPEPETQR